MAQTNADVVRALIDTINRGEWDAVLKDAAPEFELDVSRAVGPYRGVYGLGEAKGLFAEFAQGWESLRIDAGELLEAGDHVLGTSTMYVEGRDGIHLTSTVTWLWTVRDGAIVRASMFQEREQALAAAGLAKQA